MPPENIIPVDRALRMDLIVRRRSTQQSSRDGSLRGLAAEVMGDEKKARHWLSRCDALELPILNKALLQRVRSQRPVDFLAAAAAVWA